MVDYKAIPLQAWTGPETSRKLRLPDFKIIGTLRWQGCQPDAQTIKMEIRLREITKDPNDIDLLKKIILN